MVATLVRPVGDIAISCSWQCHRDRNPPSTEPGTDYACAYGTKVYAAATGTVVSVRTEPHYGGGRVVMIQASDGTTWMNSLHLSVVHASVGQKVTRGSTVIALSGASGFGENWYYGPHLHQTLWTDRSSQPVPGITGTVDFEKNLNTGGGGAVAISDADAEKIAKAVWGFSGGYGSYNMRGLVRNLWAQLTPGQAGVKYDGDVYKKVKNIPGDVWRHTLGEYTDDGVTHPEENVARRLRRTAIAADAARQRLGGVTGEVTVTDLLAAGLTPDQIADLARQISDQIEVPEVVDPEEIAEAVVDEMGDRLSASMLAARQQAEDPDE